ncbi:MAG: DUF6020 family protein [Butyrivibrio sp.]|nr:DUF6020 family protein [Butyrivibrio sp.]
MKKNNDDLLAWLVSGLFGLFSGLFLIFGYQLEKADSINLTDTNTLLVLMALILIITLDTRYVFRSYDIARGGGRLFGMFRLKDLSDNNSVTKRDFFINWGLTAALSIPVLLAEYPGFFVYDAADELNEVLTRTFTTHHPLLHVLLLGGTIAFFHKLTGSWNFGIFAYMVIQMLVITAIFAYVITYMTKRGIDKNMRYLWIVFYGAFPTIVMYTLCSCKDGLFSALLLLLTVFLIQLERDPGEFLSDRKKVALFVAVAVLMPLFRHNGFYAYLVFVPFALFHFRKELKPLLAAMLVVPVILYLIISNIFAMSLSSEVTHHQEMLTVPIMQLARVYNSDSADLTDEERAVIESYIPKKNLELYTPRVSDLVKIDFNNELYEADKKSFWNVWGALLKRHPATYLNAWLLTCYGYFYPPAIFNVYKGNTVYSFTYEDSSYFGYEVEPPGERKSLIPAIDALYRYLSLGPFQKDAPVFSLPFVPGFYLFIFMFVFAYRLYRKRFSGILPFMPMVLTVLTVFLGPTYLIRYVLVLWLCAPLLTVTAGASKV